MTPRHQTGTTTVGPGVETVLPLRNLVRIPLRLLDPHPDNVRDHVERPVKGTPRNTFDRVDDIDDMASSIMQVGLIQPLTVIPNGKSRFHVIAGHRRLEACKRAKVVDAPCIVRTDLDAAGITALMLVENLHRVDLTPLEEARALSKLQKSSGMTQDEMAEHVGRSNAWVSHRLILLTLPKEVQGRLTARQITLTEAVRLAQQLKGREPGAMDRGWNTPTFASTHPLAAGVRARCESLGHGLRRRIGNVGCGECWEALIRLDEREKVKSERRAS